MKIYGDKKSGNCLKISYISNYLGLDYQWIDVDILQGESRTSEALARNPAGQVPCVEFDGGRLLSQSNAILLYLARDSDLEPRDAWARAKIHQWLFWEQYSHEPTIAVCRFEMLYLGKPASDRDQAKVDKGDQALDLMERHLTESQWFANDSFSVADIALVAYTRLAHEGGFDLATRSCVQKWITAVEEKLDISA